MMKKIDEFEKGIIDAYERGALRSAMPSKSELKTLRDAARATSIKDRRVNIRLSSPDLTDLSRSCSRGGRALSNLDRQRSAQVRCRPSCRATRASHAQPNTGSYTCQELVTLTR